MNPDQPGNPYDFIVNPQASQPQKSLLPKLGGGLSFTKKLIFISGVAFLLVIGMWVAGTILGGGGVNRQDIVALTQMQEEIARVADKGHESADQAVKNQAINTLLTMQSQQQAWILFLAERGEEVDEKELALKMNAATDKTLDDAKANNTYTIAFRQVMGNYLAEYLAQLEADFAKATSTAQKELLRSNYEQTKLLIEQLPKS